MAGGYTITPERIKHSLELLRTYMLHNKGHRTPVHALLRGLQFSSHLHAIAVGLGIYTVVEYNKYGSMCEWTAGEVTDKMVDDILTGYYAKTPKKGDNNTLDKGGNSEVPKDADAVSAALFAKMEGMESTDKDTNTIVHEMQARLELMETTLNIMYAKIKELHADLKG